MKGQYSGQFYYAGKQHVIRLDPFYKREIEEFTTCEQLHLTRTEYRGNRDYSLEEQSKLKLLGVVIAELKDEQTKKQDRQNNFTNDRNNRRR